ncbi:MAG TPA: hypothetical protein VMF56_13610 [Acidobacteriaceae bacterium]|nr:hypothetical protein [Acidobacteriaceae bacterium]
MSQNSSELTSEPISPTAPRMWAVSLTSLLFILLQSACTVTVAFSGINAAVGLGSFATAIGLTRLTGSFHSDVIRIPMMILALAGSIFTLYIVRRARVLRARPSSQWRIRPLTPKEKRKETFQIAISLVTILLIAAEFVTHVALNHAF